MRWRFKKISSEECRIIRKFAWFPVKLDDESWVWLEKYHQYQIYTYRWTDSTATLYPKLYECINPCAHFETGDKCYILKDLFYYAFNNNKQERFLHRESFDYHFKEIPNHSQFDEKLDKLLGD